MRNRVKAIAAACGGLTLTIALAVLAIAAPAASAAQPPYEPNDSLLAAFGPLGLNQTYTAAMETENDRDFFYFYVTSPSSSQVSVTIKDLGGGLHSYTALSLKSRTPTVATSVAAG